MTSTPETSPPVLYGRRGRDARLRDGELLLDGHRERRRIPVGAIERVEVGGLWGRTLTVVLTSPAGTGAVHRVGCPSAPAVDAFAGALRRALPVRDAAEPRADGAELVTTEALERPSPERGHRGWSVAAGVYVGVAVVLAAVGAGVADVLVWLASGPVAVFGQMIVTAGRGLAGSAWALRTRGIAVEGRLEFSYAHGAEDGAVTRYVYSYVDARGVPRKHSGPDGGADRAEILYDSADPGRNSRIGRGTAARLVAGWVFVLLGGPLLVAGALGMVAAVMSPFA
ncbi:hypothetical protein [Streptomyces spiralis]